MTTTDLIAAFERLARPRVLVLGDLILDRYTWGDAERISQEAPVIVLRADQREARLGGAGNVCQMLRGLDATVTCIAAVGDDADGQALVHMLDEWQVDRAGRASGHQPADHLQGTLHRPCRRVGIRIKSCGSIAKTASPLHGRLEKRLIARLGELVRRHDLVLVSDYDKGVCTPEVLRAAIDACREAEVPVVVDPIRGSRLFPLSRRHDHDAQPHRGGPGHRHQDHHDRRRVSGRRKALPSSSSSKMAIVTLDRDGMALVHAGGRGAAFPTRPRAVYDITGAGDMVLAMIGVALASGLSAEDAVRLGNVAGGLEVEKIGVAVIPRAEIRTRLLADRPAQSDKLVDLEQLAMLVEAHRAAGQRIVLTNGCFDLLHVGHIHYLQEALAAGRRADCWPQR